MSSKITNPQIDELYDTAIKAGALGGKLLGAGGGGYLLMYCPYNIKHKVAAEMEKAGGQLADWDFELRGSSAWKTDENRWDYKQVSVSIPDGNYTFPIQYVRPIIVACGLPTQLIRFHTVVRSNVQCAESVMQGGRMLQLPNLHFGGLVFWFVSER